MPALVLAARQTAGRGRGAARWWSSDGAVTFSVVQPLQTQAAAAGHPPRVSLAAALAVCEVLGELAPEVECGLKWPNDVYLGGRKACGVLAETFPAAPNLPPRTIVGVGINVNNPVGEAPPEIAARATSLFEQTRRHHDVTDLLLAVLKRIDAERAAPVRSDPDQVSRLMARSLLDGRRVTVRQGSRRVCGRCLGLAENGALILKTDTGTQHLVDGVVRDVTPPLENNRNPTERSVSPCDVSS